MKIGAAIIACDRQDFTKQCFISLIANSRDLNTIIVVNDGQKLDKDTITTGGNISLIENDPPYQSVGVTKNKAMKALMEAGCDHIFLIENDQIIKSPDIFKTYIEASKATGIQHLNFGYHGPANRDNAYNPRARAVIDYGNVKIALNTHSVGAFSYFTRKFIKEVGYHDEYFKNAWEHVELCQRAIKKGLLPGFWWFPDVEGSYNLIEEQPNSIQKSSITHTKEWTDNMRKGAMYYKSLYGWTPVESPDTPIETVQTRLKDIYKNA